MTTTDPTDSSQEQRAREEELVERVLASFAGASDDRLREILQSLTTPGSASTRTMGLPASAMTRSLPTG